MWLAELPRRLCFALPDANPVGFGDRFHLLQRGVILEFFKISIEGPCHSPLQHLRADIDAAFEAPDNWAPTARLLNARHLARKRATIDKASQCLFCHLPACSRHALLVFYTPGPTRERQCRGAYQWSSNASEQPNSRKEGQTVLGCYSAVDWEPLPKPPPGGLRVILADPPWRFKSNSGGSRGASRCGTTRA